MTYITIPSPIPPNTNFSLYYTNNSTPPDIQPPNTIYQLTKQGNTGTVYSSFNANTSITTPSLSDPFFLTRDSQDNIYYTTNGYFSDGPRQVYLLNKNGTPTTIPTIAISEANGDFVLPSGISIGSTDNELWVADNNDDNSYAIFKKFNRDSSGNWILNMTFTPENTDSIYLDDRIFGIKYKDGFIYACCYSGTPSNCAIYSINVEGSTSPNFNIYTNTNTDSPYDLTFDTSGNLYYVNNNTNNIGSLVVFNNSSSTSTVLVLSSYIESLSAGTFLNPGGIVFNNDYTRLYITGSVSKSIMYYTIGIPNTLTTFITDDVPNSSGNSGLFDSYGIIFDSINNIYVCNFHSELSVPYGYIQKIQGIQYNFENISGLVPGSYPVNVYNFTTSSVILGTLFNINVQCFRKETRILSFIDGQEVWVNIENLKPKDLIKTYKYGYIPIKNIGWSQMTNSIHSNPNKLYVIKKNSHSELIDDLYVSGKHSRLVDSLTSEQQTLTLKIWSKLLKIDDKYLLMACVDDLFIDIKDENKYDMYQIILESDNSYKQYGIYANGILSESMSINALKKKQLKLLF